MMTGSPQLDLVGSEEEALRDTECVRQAIEELGENAPLSKIVLRAQKLKELLARSRFCWKLEAQELPSKTHQKCRSLALLGMTAILPPGCVWQSLATC